MRPIGYAFVCLAIDNKRVWNLDGGYREASGNEDCEGANHFGIKGRDDAGCKARLPPTANVLPTTPIE